MKVQKDLFGNEIKKRDVYCADSNDWLNGKKFKIIITSLPDMEEVGLSYLEWREWIIKTSKNLIDSLYNDSIIFFYQTDRKYDGQIIDKKTLISSVFLENGFNNILSKIILKREPNKIDLFRPTYTNLFAFSKNIKSGKATADVIHSGKMIYKNAMGFNAVECCINFIKSKKIEGNILDPFCGQGSVLKISNDLGFNSIGVDILEEQFKKAK